MSTLHTVPMLTDEETGPEWLWCRSAHQDDLTVALYLVTAGCVHEHLHKRVICGPCLTDLRTGRLCPDCKEVDYHDCRVHVLHELFVDHPRA